MGEEVTAWLDRASGILERDETCPKCLKRTLRYDGELKRISCSSCGFAVELKVVS